MRSPSGETARSDPKQRRRTQSSGEGDDAIRGTHEGRPRSVVQPGIYKSGHSLCRRVMVSRSGVLSGAALSPLGDIFVAACWVSSKPAARRTWVRVYICLCCVFRFFYKYCFFFSGCFVCSFFLPSKKTQARLRVTNKDDAWVSSFFFFIKQKIYMRGALHSCSTISPSQFFLVHLLSTSMF